MYLMEIDDYDGKSNYQCPIPKSVEHLLLTGFMRRYSIGSWGSYLTMWIDTEDFSLWIHYIFRDRAGTMDAFFKETIFALQYMAVGRAFGELNGCTPVELSQKWSRFFIIPGGMRQKVYFDEGTTIAMHINFKKEYLERKSKHYLALQPLMEQFSNNPSIALHEASVCHNYLMEYSWKKILDSVGKVSDPVLWLESQARELLRMHYEQLVADKLFLESDALEVNHRHIKAVHELRMILEKDISQHYTIKQLTRMVGLNEFDMKRVFKQVYKTTIHHHLLQLRMDFARDQLLSTNKSIQEIATSCGFLNTSYFAHMFKRYFKVRPLSLRNKTN